MLKKLSFVAAAVALTGCMQNVVEIQTPFDPNAGTYILANGRSAISGQAFMRQAGGGVVTCAGEDVTLTPATTYQQERMRVIYGDISGGSRTTGYGDVPPPPAPGAERLTRTTKCDAGGNFEFRNLAAGDYYVSTTVQWMASQYSYQGGYLSTRVRLGVGEAARVILN